MFTILDQIESLERYKNAISISQLEKNWGIASKYLVKVEDKKEIVEIADTFLYDRKNQEGSLIKKARKIGIPVASPIDIGYLSNGKTYFISSYIEGNDVYSSLKNLSKKEHYQLGVESGKYLKLLHKIEAPKKLDKWSNHILNKHKRYLEAYEYIGITFDGAKETNAFIEKNKEYLNTRPSTFQHDDYHLENIIIQDKKITGIIDFGNFDYGDPYFDFVKLALFQRNESIDFAIGQLNGYFNNNIPEDFWLYYSIYCAMNVFSSIVWTLNFAPELKEDMFKRLQTILEDHQYFEQTRPL